MTMTEPRPGTVQLSAGLESAVHALILERGWAPEDVNDELTVEVIVTDPVPMPPNAFALEAGVQGGGRLLLLAAEDVVEFLGGADKVIEAMDDLAQALSATTGTGNLVSRPSPTRSTDALISRPGDSAAFVAVYDKNDHLFTFAAFVPEAIIEQHIPGTRVASFDEITTPRTVAVGAHPLDVLSDVEMGVTAELGRTHMLVRDILALRPGAVVELDRAAGSPVDVLVNGTLVARGEVVVVDEEFGVRITEVVGLDSSARR